MTGTSGEENRTLGGLGTERCVNSGILYTNKIIIIITIIIIIILCFIG